MDKHFLSMHNMKVMKFRYVDKMRESIEDSEKNIFYGQNFM